MFRTLLAHLQEALHKQQLAYFVRVMSVDCYQVWSRISTLVAASRYYDARSTKHAIFHKFEKL
jgi:hypothetical protein